MSDMFKVTSLWKKTSAKGEIYLSGRMPLIDGMFINVFPRKEKKNPNEPDYDVVITRSTQKDSSSHKSAADIASEMPDVF